MGCRVTTPLRSAFGECGNSGCKTVERGGPKVGQIGHFLHVSGFWRFFRLVAGEKDTKRPCFGGCFCELQERRRRGGRGKRIWDEDRSNGWKMRSEYKVGQPVTHYYLLICRFAFFLKSLYNFLFFLIDSSLFINLTLHSVCVFNNY